MRKIPSLFHREEKGRRLCTPDVTPGCEWVLDGEGVAYRKWDGTACAAPPPGFVQAESRSAFHWFGWILVGYGPEDQYHREAWAWLIDETLPGEPICEGTYELIGPKIQGGAERGSLHLLIRHTEGPSFFVPRDFDGLREALATVCPFEGLIFYHPDGRMAKVKRRDFGLSWPLTEEERIALWGGTGTSVANRYDDPLREGWRERAEACLGSLVAG